MMYLEMIRWAISFFPFLPPALGPVFLCPRIVCKEKGEF